VTLPPAAAKRALMTEINAETAEKLVNGCVEYSQAHNGGTSVVVISPAGYLVHAHRPDGHLTLGVRGCTMNHKEHEGHKEEVTQRG
jgi:uncharacterized protein GlcG (DUF336 family)